ncbi:hypothetical protein WAK64_17855 [Bacillus spongiae]|uniref:Uncharacterized protein n=1 Tax=Bacillus spongiae TaxID=2683610 RepID=A0ABU8HHQ6_9BACI
MKRPDNDYALHGKKNVKPYIFQLIPISAAAGVYTVVQFFL